MLIGRLGLGDFLRIFDLRAWLEVILEVFFGLLLLLSYKWLPPSTFTFFNGSCIICIFFWAGNIIGEVLIIFSILFIGIFCVLEPSFGSVWQILRLSDSSFAPGIFAVILSIISIAELYSV